MPTKKAKKAIRRRQVGRRTPSPAPVRNAAVAATASKAGSARSVYLNIPGLDRFALRINYSSDEVFQLIKRWTHALRNRERWAGRSKLQEKHRQRIKEVAAEFGLDQTILAAIAGAGLVEVEITYEEEGRDWDLRILPWEYLLASATRELRGGGPLTVVRYLRRANPPGAGIAPRKWFYLECAVGKLREMIDSTTERGMVKTVAAAQGTEVNRCIDPDPDGLKEFLAKIGSGDVLHLAGYDPHQGLRFLDDPDADVALDGLLVRAPRAAPAKSADEPAASTTEVVEAERFARLLTSGKRKPRLVAINLYHSAMRTAAMCVAEGADAAIGFQDDFDDTLAELFFSTFYQAWRLSNWNTAAAFRHAWTLVSGLKMPLHGSGVVLWSARSIRETLPGYWGKGREWSAQEINKRWASALLRSGQRLSADNAAAQIEIEIVPVTAMNYSVLHNNGPLFERFTIRKQSLDIGQVDNLHIKVELHVGTDSYPYRQTLELGEQVTQIDLSGRIRISLASALSRALRESVRTSLFVEVLWHETALYRQTHVITLLPIDEWKDTDDCRVWLPSFVLPRDPVVPRVIDRAQRYLMAIADDPTMGFSGYQSVDEEAPADAAPEERCAGVDAQVRAIWSSLLYESPLSYINPPPVFSDYSQRLRTPSDVIDGRRGTCIDLALLLASCLEYVDIYPVVFLLSDHAFPGYWRDATYYDRFLEALADPDQSADDQGKGKGKGQGQGQPGQRYSWYLERANFREILGEIHAGRLVPLETVHLTSYQGFAAALDAGKANLTSRQQFQAMLDITSARWDDQNRVTPLPVIKG